MLLPLLYCRFSKGLAAKAELQQDIIRIIKAGKTEQQQQQQQDGEQSSVFRYMLDARRQTQTTVGSCCVIIMFAHQLHSMNAIVAVV
jgi:hypothetical protein